MVYNRPRHAFSAKRLASIATTLNNALVNLPTYPEEDFYPWNVLWKVARNAAQAIYFQHADAALENAFVLTALNSNNQALVNELWGFVQGGRAFIAGLSKYGGSIPYVGQVADAGIALIDGVIMLCFGAVPEEITVPEEEPEEEAPSIIPFFPPGPPKGL